MTSLYPEIINEKLEILNDKISKYEDSWMISDINTLREITKQVSEIDLGQYRKLYIGTDRMDRFREITQLEKRIETLKQCCVAYIKAKRQQSFEIINNLLSEINDRDNHTVAVYINRYTKHDYDKTIMVCKDVIAFRELNNHLIEMYEKRLETRMNKKRKVYQYKYIPPLTSLQFAHRYYATCPNTIKKATDLLLRYRAAIKPAQRAKELSRYYKYECSTY